MATLPVPAQPDLRPFVVYDELSDHCIAHAVSEASCPLLHQGEYIVVDTSDREIDRGDLFLMESGRNSPTGPTRNVVEFRQRNFCIRDDDGEFRDQPCWTALFYSELNPVGGGTSRPIRFMDGPVKLSAAAYFNDRIIGRVVGILETSFVEPMRRAA